MENKSFLIILTISLVLGLIVTFESYIYVEEPGIVFVFLLHIIILTLFANTAYKFSTKSFMKLEQGLILCLSLCMMKSLFLLYIIIENMVFIKPDQNHGFLLVGISLLLWAIIITLFESLFAFIISILMPYYIYEHFLKRKTSQKT